MRSGRDYASVLNPAAGAYPVTTDERELAACVAANERSFREFPYYEMRYGERGRAFGVSDGAWLINVCDMPAAEIRGQFEWLGSVLSSRGMPRLLLEWHLRFLYDELPRRVRYRPLLRAADEMRRARKQRIPSADRIAAEFRRTDVPRFGEILVAAVADEADGITAAVSSIESWALDRDRFKRSWITEAQRTIAAARAAVR